MANRLNLVLHCGAAKVSREQIVEVATPEATESWHPISHKSLVDMLTERIESYGMQIVNEAHGLWKDGLRYFGMFQVAGTDGASVDDDFGLVFGLRNSHDKTFPAGLCLGSGVFVCDNLAFSAEIVLGRRHTRHIMRDLPNLVTTSVGRLMEARTVQANRLAAYKEHELTNTEAQSLIVDAFRAGAINTTRIPKVIDQWYNPAHPEFKDRTVWSLFNGFTEVYKETSLTELPTRSTRLHGILDAHCGLLTNAKDVIQADFADNNDVIVA